MPKVNSTPRSRRVTERGHLWSISTCDLKLPYQGQLICCAHSGAARETGAGSPGPGVQPQGQLPPPGACSQPFPILEGWACPRRGGRGSRTGSHSAHASCPLTYPRPGPPCHWPAPASPLRLSSPEAGSQGTVHTTQGARATAQPTAATASLDTLRTQTHFPARRFTQAPNSRRPKV